MPERSEEAEFGVNPTTVSQTHPNVHMETPAQMDNKEAIKHLAPQVPSVKGESTRVPDPQAPAGSEKLTPQDPTPRQVVNKYED